MRRVRWVVVLVATAVIVYGQGWAQQGGRGFQAQPQRFQPGQVGGKLACLDTYTGRLHVTPAGEGLGAEAVIVDLPRASMWRRPLARDVSGGRVLEHGIPSGNGAGATVFTWHPNEGVPGVLDTRSGVHYALQGEVGPQGKVVRTDLRLLTRSVREVKHISKLRQE